MAEQTINWNKVNPVISSSLEIIQTTYPNQVGAFLDWYEQQAGSTRSIYDPVMVQWVIDGIPRVRSIITALNKEIDTRLARVTRTATGPGTVQTKIEATKRDRDTIKGLRELIVDFLGCRNQLGEWFVGLLDLLAARFPQKAVFRNTIPDFQNICLVNRQALLSL